MMKEKRKNIAIIGSGISGLGAAYMLAPHHDITVYERNNYIGGHSRTVDISTSDGKIAVDTGFIVFNYQNYPLLGSLFSYLNVPVEKSNMSFGASINNGWFEYKTNDFYNIFSQKSNLLRYQYWCMILDILKFRRSVHRSLERDASFTLGELLDQLGTGTWFRDYFLLAMGGAIWSTPLAYMLEFPAHTFVRFFDNHGLLSISDRRQWYTVKGGSREYVKRLTANFNENMRVGCGVQKVVRQDDAVIVHDSRRSSLRFDEVIFACHADQVLELIQNPTEDERSTLGSMHTQANRVVLHSDVSFMPKRKSAWASWVYLFEGRRHGHGPVSLSYWMNNLQPLDTDTPIIVTLNPGREPKKELIHDEHWFDHPIFDSKAVAAQLDIDSLQGRGGLWFCGAYQRYGFHEDGLASAVRVAKRLGAHIPWA